ncbi:shikimate dehydrogenase [Opitutus sp. GAS368]|uniref:shikimate dehydrogenase family protein n=1 Tax=Opitutus sp. GAS368 TaxID=1882749 RepID=UPI00087D5038|nr:shikimate dehydrogenase [Opitutus sp. GAS368]SDR93195.1 shikimate dehydrogenase [Opitutus sp. GAS368]
MSAVAESIHTLADLEAWSFPGTALAVIGRPVAHSLSPAIHNAALAELAQAQPKYADWHYFKFDIAPAELPRALSLFHKNRFHGLNLTVPHKSLAVEHLVTSDAFVRAAGAANTLTYSESGWRGANTDGYGLTTALREDLRAELAGAHIILLGAGGAARGAAVECLRARCASLWIGNRTAATLDALLLNLQMFAGESVVRGFTLANPPPGLPAGATVINATSLGLAPTDAPPLDLKKIPAPARVYDMIYRPPQTTLLRQAAELGLPHANGLSMLIHQGARSLEIWTGGTVPVPVMQAAARAALNPA